MHKRFRLLRALSLTGFVVFSAHLPLALAQENGRASLRSESDRKAAPELALEDSSGKPVTLKNHQGKVVLLGFWASWCHGCKEEIPWFSQFERKYAEKGFRVIGVSMDENGWKVVRPLIRAAAVPYRIALGNDAVAKSYGITNMPDTFLLDRDGKIAASYVGLVDRENIENNIGELLRQ